MSTERLTRPPRRRRIFGPLLKITLAIALIELVGLAIWPTLRREVGGRWEAARLARALGDPNPSVAGAAATGLAKLGPIADGAVRDALRRGTPAARRRACEILDQTSARPADALPALIAALEDPDAQVRATALQEIIRNLPDVAPDAARREAWRAARPALRRLAADPAEPGRTPAAQLLISAYARDGLGDEDVLWLLRDADPALRISAAVALGRVNSPHRDAGLRVLESIATAPTPQGHSRASALSWLVMIAPERTGAVGTRLAALLDRPGPVPPPELLECILEFPGGGGLARRAPAGPLLRRLLPELVAPWPARRLQGVRVLEARFGRQAALLVGGPVVWGIARHALVSWRDQRDAWDWLLRHGLATRRDVPPGLVRFLPAATFQEMAAPAPGG